MDISGLEDLPDELQMHILSFIDPDDLHSLCQTCSKFYNMLWFDESFWRHAIYQYSTQRVYVMRQYPEHSRKLLANAYTFDTINAALAHVRTQALAAAVAKFNASEKNADAETAAGAETTNINTENTENTGNTGNAGEKDTPFILLLPGQYEESFILDKSAHILGWDEDRSKTVLTNTNSSAINISAPTGSIRNVTIQQISGYRQRMFFGITISAGAIQISDCDITSKERSCIGISGKGTTPTIRNNFIHNSSAAGICAFDNSSPLILENEICFCKFSGIEITMGADPTIHKNKIYSNEGSGVYVHNNGTGLIKENDIYNNESSGIGIKSDGNPILENNIIRDGKRSGVFVYPEGKGTILRNKIFNNAYNGIENMSESIVIEDNEEYGNKKVPEDIERILARGYCTYVLTGKEHRAQNWYYCYTCKLTGNDGCCVACAETCHKGHDVRYHKFGLFFCDCGDRNSQCQALRALSSSND